MCQFLKAPNFVKTKLVGWVFKKYFQGRYREMLMSAEVGGFQRGQKHAEVINGWFSIFNSFLQFSLGCSPQSWDLNSNRWSLYASILFSITSKLICTACNND